jgi:hypothetical protein
MMRREPVLALQCTKRTNRVGGSQKGPSGPPGGEGEEGRAKIAKAMQRCDKSEDISTAGLAECVRAEGEASRAGCRNDVENSVKCGRFRRHSHGYIVLVVNMVCTRVSPCSCDAMACLLCFFESVACRSYALQ